MKKKWLTFSPPGFRFCKELAPFICHNKNWFFIFYVFRFINAIALKISSCFLMQRTQVKADQESKMCTPKFLSINFHDKENPSRFQPLQFLVQYSRAGNLGAREKGKEPSIPSILTWQDLEPTPVGSYQVSQGTSPISN